MPCRCNSASVASASETSTVADTNNNTNAFDGRRCGDTNQRASMDNNNWGHGRGRGSNNAVAGVSTNNCGCNCRPNCNNAVAGVSTNNCGHNRGRNNNNNNNNNNAVAGISDTRNNCRHDTSFWPVFAEIPDNSSNHNHRHHSRCRNDWQDNCCC